MKSSSKKKRVVVYLDEQEYTTLRSRLILVGMSVSQWVRKQIHNFLKKQ